MSPVAKTDLSFKINQLERILLFWGLGKNGPILASVALAESRLGKELIAQARRPGTVVSVYVDDIVVSCDDLGLLQADARRLREAATASKFVLNPAKTHGPASSVTAFNIEISGESIAIAEGKFAELSRRVADDDESTASKNGIISYVGSVSPEQAEILNLLHVGGLD